MVRFSDMLGGNDKEQPAPAVPEPTAEIAEPEVPEAQSPEPDVTEPETSPEDLLDRLTNYATSARAADQVPDPEPRREPEAGAQGSVEPGSADDLAPVGDDLLPRGKRGKRRG